MKKPRQERPLAAAVERIDKQPKMLNVETGSQMEPSIMEPSRNEQGGSRLDFLDGLRGWGAVFVMLYHVFCNTMPVTAWTGGHLWKLLPFNGLYPVCVFFLVSGFSISIRFLSNGDYRTLVRIAAGRYVRLVIPVFAACLVVHCAILAGGLSPARRPPFDYFLNFAPSFSHLIRFSFVDVFFNYSIEGTYIGPLWTMSIEFLGSLVLLVSLCVLPKSHLRPWLLAGISAALLLPFQHALQGIYAVCYALFFIGAMLADSFHREWIRRVPLSIGILLFIAGCAGPAVLPFSFDSPNLLGASVLALGSLTVPFIRNCLSGRLSKALGVLSFPLYLIHGPVLMFFGEPMNRIHGQSPAGRLVVDLLVVLFSFLAAFCFIPVNVVALKASRWLGSSVCLLFGNRKPQAVQLGP